MKEKIFGGLEVFAKTMVQPLMYLSSAGILMVIGVLLTNNMITGTIPFLQWEPIQIFGKLIYNCVMVIINNLSVIFAIGIPAALAKKEKHKAALIGFMSYIMYLTASNTMLTSLDQLAQGSEMLGLTGTGQASVLGIQIVDTSVFGGIILGCITGYIFNRTSEKRFKGALQIYSGANFSFICMFFVSIIFGVVSNLVWPLAQQGIASIANIIKNTGTFGLFLYGFLERILVPTGLHHLIYTPFQFSDLGGVLQVGTETVAGAYAIVMSEIGLPVERFSDSIYYMATGFTKMFGYIGIGLAFIHTAYKHNKKKVKAAVIPLVVTAILASVTEPLDFMFAFVAPLLFVVHAAISGLFIALLKIFDVSEIGLPVERFSDSIYYMATGFTKMFGYIGIGMAFIHTAYKHNKKKVKAAVIPLVVTAILASVTEPLDFMFAFVAPLLFVVHAAIAGLFIALLKIFDVTAFCGGNLLASLIMNITVGVEKTHWPVMVILGLVQILVYFVVFSLLIKKFNLN